VKLIPNVLRGPRGLPGASGPPGSGVLPRRSTHFVEGKGKRPLPVLWRGAWRPMPKNQVGIKRLYMLGPLDGTVKTPWGAKALARRRAKNRVAKQSRKVNRRG
jgi:hypothetical protein